MLIMGLLCYFIVVDEINKKYHTLRIIINGIGTIFCLTGAYFMMFIC